MSSSLSLRAQIDRDCAAHTAIQNVAGSHSDCRAKLLLEGYLLGTKSMVASQALPAASETVSVSTLSTCQHSSGSRTRHGRNRAATWSVCSQVAQTNVLYPTYGVKQGATRTQQANNERPSTEARGCNVLQHIFVDEHTRQHAEHAYCLTHVG